MPKPVNAYGLDAKRHSRQLAASHRLLLHGRHYSPQTTGSSLPQINAYAQDLDLAVVNVFHAGDGNLHPLILYDASIPGDYDKAEQLGGQILRLCVEVGGTITGEHGVGLEKLNHMCVQFSTAEIQQFQRLKARSTQKT